MRTRRGKRRHPGRAATLRGAERHPKPGATPGLRVRKLRASRFGTRPARVASGSGRGRPALEGRNDIQSPESKARGAAGRGARRSNGFAAATGESIPHRAGPAPGDRRENTGRDARCATTKRSTPGVRTRGAPVPGSAGGAAWHGSFPPPPCSSRTPDLSGGRLASSSAVSAGSLLRFCGVALPGSAALRKRGKVAPPPLIVMRQSRRKKRPPLAPKDPA